MKKTYKNIASAAFLFVFIAISLLSGNSPSNQRLKVENKQIKKTGTAQKEWKMKPKLTQKDIDAKWTKRNSEHMQGWFFNYTEIKQGGGVQHFGGEEPTQSNPRMVTVSNAMEMAVAVTEAQAGDRIELTSTAISGNYTISANGTADNPIIITSQNNNWGGGLSGNMIITGQHIKFWKMRLHSIDLSGADCRISRCYFTVGNIRVRPGGVRAVIEYNEVRNYSSRAIWFNANTGPTRPFGSWVHHNYVVDGTETSDLWLAIGWTGGTQEGAFADHSGLFEWNLVENHPIGFAFESKTTNIIWRFNTARNCSNGFESRIGNFNDWIGNSVISDANRGSFQMHGKGHRVIGNYNNRTTPDINQSYAAMSGTIEAENYLNSSVTPRWANAKNCLYSGNIGPLYIGGGASAWNVPADGTVIENHSGQITLASGRHINTTDNRNGPSTVTVPQYVILQPSDVGPNANLSPTSVNPESTRISSKSDVIIYMADNILKVAGYTPGKGRTLIHGYNFQGSEIFSSPVETLPDGSFEWKRNTTNTASPIIVQILHNGQVLVSRVIITVN